MGAGERIKGRTCLFERFADGGLVELPVGLSLHPLHADLPFHPVHLVDFLRDLIQDVTKADERSLFLFGDNSLASPGSQRKIWDGKL